jgi:hypothetical protein
VRPQALRPARAILPNSAESKKGEKKKNLARAQDEAHELVGHGVAVGAWRFSRPAFYFILFHLSYFSVSCGV